MSVFRSYDSVEYEDAVGSARDLLAGLRIVLLDWIGLRIGGCIRVEAVFPSQGGEIEYTQALLAWVGRGECRLRALCVIT